MQGESRQQGSLSRPCEEDCEGVPCRLCGSDLSCGSPVRQDVVQRDAERHLQAHVQSILRAI